MRSSPIEIYLRRLEDELRLRRAPRRRLLAEAEDHLRSAVEEHVAAGRLPADAEQEAIERFGAAPEVALRFAQTAASSAARSAAGWTAAAFLAYGAAALVFLATAPTWLRDFPQGAPSTLALQVAAVALAVTAARLLGWLRAGVLDVERLCLVANGAAIATAALAVGAGGELLVALTRPAAAPWADAPAPTATFALAAALLVPAAVVAATGYARTSGFGGHGGGPSLADDVAAVAPSLGRIVRTALRRPTLTCATFAGSAIVAVPLAQLVGADASLYGALPLGLLEATAIVVGFLTLGRPLGFRAAK